MKLIKGIKRMIDRKKDIIPCHFPCPFCKWLDECAESVKYEREMQNEKK